MSKKGKRQDTEYILNKGNRRRWDKTSSGIHEKKTTNGIALTCDRLGPCSQGSRSAESTKSETEGSTRIKFANEVVQEMAETSVTAALDWRSFLTKHSTQWQSSGQNVNAKNVHSG